MNSPAFEIIGVVDLLDGRAVHARAGRRDAYRPVTVADRHGIPPGDALALARLYVETIGVAELYAADLDAILHGRWQDSLTSALAEIAPLWLDAGLTTRADAERALALGVARLVVGLETLPSFAALKEACELAGGERVSFSLDLRDGVPLVREQVEAEPAETLARRAVDAGAGTIVVLDLARVGTGRGLDIDLLTRLRRATPDVRLFAGGGVRGPEDVERLAAIGCNGALVATALLEGRLLVGR